MKHDNAHMISPPASTVFPGEIAGASLKRAT